MGQQLKSIPCILIGGYGEVGRELAKLLSDKSDHPIWIAGRNIKKGENLSRELGSIANSLAIDTKDPSTFGHLKFSRGIVILQAPDPNAVFTEYCLLKGLHVLWVTTEYVSAARTEKLNQIAKEAKSIFLMGTGLAPGLSTLAAINLLKKSTGVKQLDIGVLLGLGEHHGPDALSWFLNAEPIFDHPAVGRFARSIPWPKSKNRHAFSFAFPDPFLSKNQPLQVDTVRHWASLDPNWVSHLTRWIFATGITRLSIVRSLSGWIISHVKFGTDICGIWVGISSDDRPEIFQVVQSHGQSRATASVVAHCVERLGSFNDNFGMIDIGQLTNFDLCLSELKKDIPATRSATIGSEYSRN